MGQQNRICFRTTCLKIIENNADLIYDSQGLKDRGSGVSKDENSVRENSVRSQLGRVKPQRKETGNTI